jgi:hypothetical protein
VNIMKSNCLAKALAFSAVILLSAGAFAASKGNMELLHPASLGGKQLPAGSYTVQWDGQGDQVQVQVFQGKKAVASSTAHVVKLDHAVSESSVVVVPSNDGSRSVSRINFGKKDFALELENEGAGAGAGAAAAK